MEKDWKNSTILYCIILMYQSKCCFSLRCESNIPPNVHGVHPSMLVDSEMKVTQNNLIHTIPRISTEWSLSLTIRIEKSRLGYWKSIIHFSTGENYSRLPAIFLSPSTDTLHICYDINGNVNHCHDPPIKIGKSHHVTVHQRYISNGYYKYFIIFDGLEVHSVIKKQAQQFYNVQVFTGDPWYAADDYISNVEFTNYL
uniref:Uncharacterized protein n=1 Tax=Clytia hemisphaerica TaxID=252671 RepID=A0A7M5V841_9CNID|eukprot:TCONS_00050048-protein